MPPLGLEGDPLVRVAFQRALAVIYLVAFLVAANQFRPLAGEDGLMPLAPFLDRVEFTARPSLFHYAPTDRAIGIAAWTGVALSLVALFAGPHFLPQPVAVPASMLLWATLWGLYLSFVNVGQLFYGYGWESMLCETGFLAIFLGAGPAAPPAIVFWLLAWLLFRNMFGAGLIKLRGDDCWRELTCMDDHYETQPMPNPLSWYAHHLPKPFHRLEVLGNHVTELAIPFLFFAPQPYASVGAVATIGFQAWLMLTGNFSWLNALTIVQAVAVLGGGVLGGGVLLAILPIGAPVAAPAAAPTPLYLHALAGIVALVVIAKSVDPVRNMLSARQVMNTSFDPLNLVNTYGAFGSITKTRYQLVVEGTQSEAPNPDPEEWEEYEFKGQPVRTDRRPPQWAPYHLRLDWQLWFAAMRPRPGPRQRWVHALLARLLDGDDATLSLLRSTPFEEPPAQVRVLRYRYRFTTPEERADSGDWWHRERLGTYVGPASLQDLRTRGLA